MPTQCPVLIVGGYGAFGMRAAERMARYGDIDLIIAGRDATRAEAAAANLRAAHAPASNRTITSAKFDANTATPDDLAKLGCSIVLNASGPFQNASARLAQTSIDAGCHYVDLADDRAFVTGITALDAQAKNGNVLVVSGASTVPAISAAVIDHYRPRFQRLRTVTYGISPGNSFDPGLATTQSILSYVGKPFATRIDGRSLIVHGWQGLRRRHFGSLGPRWLGDCDIPDLDLFASRYPEIETLRFGAGVEVGLFHLGMWGLSWLVRAGLVRNPQRLARPLLSAKHWLSFLGTDAGGMAMRLEGDGPDGKPLQLNWSLVARSGHGPMIPPTPAVVIIRKLLHGTLTTRGAQPCLGLVTLAEIQQELTDLAIEFNLA